MADSIRTMVLREVATAFQGHREVASGTITSYNDQTHTARVLIQPEGEPTGDLDIGTLWHGLRPRLDAGMSCLVAYDRGQPRTVVCVWYDDARPARGLAPFVFPDGVHVLGPLTLAGLLTPAVLTALPPASAAFGHAIVALAPAGSVDGGAWYCQPYHDGTYAWVQVGATSTALTNPMTAVGDLIRGGSAGAPTRLSIGTAGQVLTVAGGVPTWATPAAGGGWPAPIHKSANYTMATGDGMVIADTGGLTITLPANAAAATTRPYIVKAGNVSSTTVAAAGADTIDGSATAILSAPYTSISLVSDASGAWWII